jgi:transposase
MDLRELKGLEIAARYKIVFADGVWLVPSQTSPGTNYRVNLEGTLSCQCEDWQLRQQAIQPCKHMIAARLTCEREYGGKAPKIDIDAVPKRPTYSQDWPAYNLAQRQEKDRLQILLADLCSGIVDRPRTCCGPKPVPLADRLFSVCFKVWSMLPSRRFGCDLRETYERGYLSRPLHPNKINCFMGDEELTPYLRAMIVRSSLPLRAIETAFAVDSSGFSVSKFVRWFDEKYGVTRSGRDWVKVHLACGVKTHVVTAAVIYGRDAGDCPLLPELLKTTAENFTVKEMSADKAYLSVENIEAVFTTGGIPFIAPKSNTTGGAGGLFEKMYHFYLYRRDEFLAHYHKRSNVESVFSAVKRKFGDSVRSRSPTSMVNEVLAKLVCHNLCCVILSQCELGIEPEFWQDEDGKQPDILPLKRISPA